MVEQLLPKLRIEVSRVEDARFGHVRDDVCLDRLTACQNDAHTWWAVRRIGEVGMEPSLAHGIERVQGEEAELRSFGQSSLTGDPGPLMDGDHDRVGDALLP